MSATKFLDEHVTHRMTRTASEAVSRGQFVQVNASDHNQVDLVDTASTDRAIGVAEHDVTAADIAAGADQLSVACGGRVIVLAGGTIAAGNTVTVDASGDGVAVGTTATVLYQTAGIALTAAADTELFTMLWAPGAHFGSNAS